MQNFITISNMYTFVSVTSIFPEMFYFLLAVLQDLNVSLIGSVDQIFDLKILI